MGRPEFKAENIPVALKPGDSSAVDIKTMLGYSITID